MITQTNCGHGHVIPNADGLKARCGGPLLCIDCARDAITDKIVLQLAHGNVPDCFVMSRAGSIAFARLYLELASKMSVKQ